jgi:hypothetical protein
MTLLRRTLAAVFLLLASVPAFATCGSENPNCIVVTRTPGDSTGAAASTAFVTNALSSTSLTVGTTAVTGGTSGRVLYDNAGVLGERAVSGTGTTVATTTGSLVSGNCVKIDASGNLIDSGATCGGTGALVSIVTYSSTQTITIPATATKGFVRMWGGSGGSGGAGSGTVTAAIGGSGAGGYLEKYLTGLTPGNTIAYTQGAAGAAGTSAGGNGGNGGASSLASGTQTITTLTANGSNGSAGSNINACPTTTAGTAGGTATNGDVNITGAAGTNGLSVDANAVVCGTLVGGAPGGSLFAPGAKGVIASGVATAGNAGQSGGLIIFWFT